MLIKYFKKYTTSEKAVLHCDLNFPEDMLVASFRPAQHISDLTQAEVSDLFSLVQRVSDITQKQFQTSSVTVAVQDGPDAGQTVQVGNF